jgi:peptide/nickel transport system substrate-binding protein
MNRFSLLIIVLGTLLSSCKSDPRKSGNDIHIRLKKDPERINPIIAPNATSREIYQYIHLPCADYDPITYQLVPILLKAIPTEISIDTGRYKGGVSFDLEFKDDARWDDGSPITAEDYAFTVKAINLPTTNAGKYRENTANITEIIIDKTNSKKCKVIFGQDYLLALETASNIEIYQKFYYDPAGALSKYSMITILDTLLTGKDTSVTSFAKAFNGNEYSRTKIQGSGPYKFVSWQTDQTVVLEKKQNYWGAKVGIEALKQGPDKMIFHIIPDEVTAFGQLQSGGVDLMTEVDADKFDDFQKDPNSTNKYSFFNPELFKYYLININNGDPKLSDKRVRKALNHLVDVDDIIKNLENNKAVRINSPVHPIKKTYNSALKPIALDIEAAKTLLTEAGWKDSNKDGIIDKLLNGKKTEMNLDIHISGQELGKRIALMLKDNAAKVGIAITIVEKDFKIIRAENLKTRQYHLVPVVVSQDMQKWDDMSGRWHSRNDNPSGANEISYRNPAVDKLIDNVLVSKNENDRMKIYQDIQQLIYDDYPVIFLYAPQERTIVSKKWNAKATAKRPGYLANTFTLAGAAVSNN